MTSLQQRVLTALLLAPIAILAVLMLSTLGFAWALGLILLGAAWEWSALAGLASPVARSGYVVLIAAALILLAYLPGFWLQPLLLIVSLWWWLVGFRLTRIDQIPLCSRPQPAQMLTGLVVLTPPWLALSHLHAFASSGPALVLFLLALIWVADIAAYFSGRRWGTTKLAPLISPGKTWAGVYGAMTGASLLGLALGLWLHLSPMASLGSLALCLATALTSVVGDLYESLLKRRRGLKDSGRLLPGHGGLLDRIDSLTAAAPLFVLGLGGLGILS